MEVLILKPVSLIEGTIDLPGAKSISIRVLLLSALAYGTTILTNLLDSEDVGYMLNALKLLGVHYSLSNNRTCCRIIGNRDLFNNIYGLKLFIGNAGIVMRLLSAVLCLESNNVILTGTPRMKERPIGHLVDALRQGGAQIKYLEKEYYPPIHLYSGFRGGEISLDGSISSQFLTALLITAPLVNNNTYIEIKGNLVSKPYIDITLHLMNIFGVKVENQLYKSFTIHGKQQYLSPGNYLIEGDASSASYFLAAAAIKGGTVKTTGIGRNTIQGDINFINVLKKMGALITFDENYISCTHGELNGIDIDANDIPDTAMTIATTAIFANGTTTLRNIYNWRLKETDRLSAMAIELRKLGAFVKEGKDYISITPPSKLKFATINTYDDHRIAMCFSLLSLSRTSIAIINPKCTSKTFPEYFNKLAHISILA